MAVTIDGAGEINGVVLPTTSFGKVLQVVRATDTTNRSTTSTSFVDVTGMSVTITPQKSTSAVLVIAIANCRTVGSDVERRFDLKLTDSSNNSLSGLERLRLGTSGYSGFAAEEYSPFILGRSTPATTSAVTFKLRFMVINTNTTLSIDNADNTGQMYAIEVSA